MTKRLGLIFTIFIIILMVFLLLILKPRGNAQRPNVILISIDTLRRDHVGIYGYDRDTTPAVDRTAGQGIYFKNAFSTAPWTLPAHMSLFTGLPPSVHGVEKERTALSRDYRTLTEIIKAKGYNTAGFITLPYVSKSYGFSRGFDIYEQHFQMKATEITGFALNWLKKNKGQKFFLFLHYCDPHTPYVPAEKYAGMFGIDATEAKWKTYGKFLTKYKDPDKPMPADVRKKVTGMYDGEIRCVDDNIDRLVEFLRQENILDNTILVITSDHGEEFKEHESFGHGHSFYAEVLNIPLIIRFPKQINRGSVGAEPVSIADIPITLLNMLKITPPRQFKTYAVDLRKYFNGQGNNRGQGKRVLFAESTRGGAKRFAVIEEGYKYFPPFEFFLLKRVKKSVYVPEGLYNIYDDPADTRNLIRDNPRGKGAAVGDRSRKAEPYNSFTHEEFSQKNKIFTHSDTELNNHKASLREFIEKNAAGIKLVFSPAREAGGTLQNYHGTIKFEHELADLPFGINFTKGDSIKAADIPGRFAFTVTINGGHKGIVFPAADNTRKIALEIYHNGQLLLKKLLKAPGLKTSLQLLQGRGQSGDIYLKGSISKKAVEQSSLSDKEREVLKSLGYI